MCCGDCADLNEVPGRCAALHGVGTAVCSHCRTRAAIGDRGVGPGEYTRWPRCTAAMLSWQTPSPCTFMLPGPSPLPGLTCSAAPAPQVHASARRALPQLLHSYLAAATGTPAAAPPPPPPGKAGALAAAPPPAAALSAEAAAGAQLLLGRVWEAATRVLAHTVVGQEGAAAAALPVPRSSTRADVLSLLVAVVEAVDGALLPQAWVEQAFAAMQVGATGALVEGGGEEEREGLVAL